MTAQGTSSPPPPPPPPIHAGGKIEMRIGALPGAPPQLDRRVLVGLGVAAQGEMRGRHRVPDASSEGLGMMPKSGHRFSERIMPIEHAECDPGPSKRRAKHNMEIGAARYVVAPASRIGATAARSLVRDARIS